MSLGAGERLGPYEILAPIGEGGMGEVYKARDTRLDRVVAIKVTKDQFTERFEREARLVAVLNHPHICQLHDAGPNYLVFEYIDGAQVKGPMPPENALRIALQIVEALEEAHKHGIIHRDLKPANILLTTHGVKVLDFGLAKQSREGPASDDETQTSELTRAGGVLGTPAYMAPERWQGKPADARSDIYAFGCVLYELLTGARAGRERTPAKPAALEATVRKCLADDPAERFQSAADLKTALVGAAEGGGRARWYAITALLLFAAGAAGFLWQHHEQPSASVGPPGGTAVGGRPVRTVVPPSGTPAGATVIELGETADQVIAVFGQPQKIITLGAKKMYVFKDLKVTFINGKLSDAE
jgi:serine/threonine protein kinase